MLSVEFIAIQISKFQIIFYTMIIFSYLPFAGFEETDDPMPEALPNRSI